MQELDHAACAVRCEDLLYPSAAEGSTIHALCWEPADAVQAQSPRAIVQIVHGMAEHIGRYDDFARFLAARGYVVCGNSHIGHGKSASSPDRLSLLPVDGAESMIADVRTLQALMRRRLGEGVPYVLFGHSMGSFITRIFLARFGADLTAAVVCGTGQVPVAASRFGGWLARRIAAAKGADAKSTFINGLADGAYGKKIPNARTGFDWLNTDPAQVDAYIHDPLCGVMFSVGGYASLMDLTAETSDPTCAAAVPSGLPVLFVAGSQDPVGNFGRGVVAAAQAIEQRSGAQVDCILYEDMRHEILNEPAHMKVYADVLAFIEGALDAAGEEEKDEHEVCNRS